MPNFILRTARRACPLMQQITGMPREAVLTVKLGMLCLQQSAAGATTADNGGWAALASGSGECGPCSGEEEGRSAAPALFESFSKARAARSACSCASRRDRRRPCSR